MICLLKSRRRIVKHTYMIGINKKITKKSLIPILVPLKDKDGGEKPRADKICQSGYKKHRYFFDDQSLQLFATHFDTATASGVVCPNRFSFYKKGFPALLRIALIGADVA